MWFASSTFAAALLSSAGAFAPTMSDVQRLSILFSTVEATPPPPVKQTPGAGWEPEWEGREGLPASEFMTSDMTKPDRSDLWECPLTRWDSEG